MFKKKTETTTQTNFPVELIIHQNPKLEKLFPIDKNANLLVKCGYKEFKLKIAYLRPESSYFEKLAEEGQSQAEFNPLDFGISGEASFEKILLCLYGGKAIIETPNELCSAYIICQILGIQKLIENLEEIMNRNIQNFNFFTLFQFAIRYYIDSLLDTCKSYLNETKFACLKDISIPKNKSISSSVVVPTQFLELDTSATIALLKINKEFEYLSALDVFSLIKAKANQDVRLFATLSQMFIPTDKLSSADFSYIQKCMTDQEYAMYSASSTNQREIQESRIYELESENVYYQKKNKELEQQNEQLKNEMLKMKEAINLKTEEFTTNQANLKNKLNSLQNSLTAFENSEAANKSEYYEKNKEMSQLIQQQAIKIGEQMHQIQNLLSVINNFKNESPSSLYPSKPENSSNVKPQTTQGFYRAQTQENNQQNSMMTVQSYNITAEGGGKMAYSNAVPLYSNLVSANQSLFYNLPAAQKKQAEASKGMKLQCQEYEHPGCEEEETKTNEMQSQNNRRNDFISFEDDVTSNVLEDSKSDYGTLFEQYFELSQFKKLKLKLLYRSSDHGFSRKQFRKQVAGAGETLILVKSWERKSPQYFGGYLSVPWSNQEAEASGRFTRDDNAFLFSISQKCKMPVKNPEYALFEKDGLFFSFGRKDLCIAEKGDEETVNSSIIPQDYQASNSKGCVIAGSTSFLVDILEVFLISREEEMDF